MRFKISRGMTTQLIGLGVTAITLLVITRPILPILPMDRVTSADIMLTMIAGCVMLLVGLPRLLRPA